MVTTLIKGWFKIVIGCMTQKGMERFLGRLELALRPQADTMPILSGAYRWKMIGDKTVTTPLIRPLLIAVIFAILP